MVVLFSISNFDNSTKVKNNFQLLENRIEMENCGKKVSF